MPRLSLSDGERVRLTLMALSNTVREMIASGAKPIPAKPDRFNLLARPLHNTCSVCGLPGHNSANIRKASACRIAIVSLIGFWEDMGGNISFLYQCSERFQNAIKSNVATYEMRLDNTPPKGGDMEVVLVDRLTRNYLKFQAHFARIRPKAAVILHNQDDDQYQHVTETLNGFLLDGLSLSDLFERSIANSLRARS